MPSKKCSSALSALLLLCMLLCLSCSNRSSVSLPTPTVIEDSAPTPTIILNEVPSSTSAPAENPSATPALLPTPTVIEDSTPTPTIILNEAPSSTSAPAENPSATPALLPSPTATEGSTPTPAVVTNTPSPTTAPQNTPSADLSVSARGQLKVIGTQLCDNAGNPVVLRGLSTAGIAWFPNLSTKAYMQTLKNEWNTTVFRIAMYSYEGDNSYLRNPEWNKAKVCELIDAAIDLDLYVIVDWHILADGNPQTYQTEAVEFFTYISSRYPNVPNILYELCNEPNGAVTWSGNIKPYANAVIPAIRKSSPNAVIIVGTPTWSQDVDAAAKDPLSQDNIMYSLHFYAATHKEWLRQKADTALAAGLALFVTEWGTTDASGSGAIDAVSSDAWLDYLDAHQISWCNWSLCNKSEGSAILKSSAAVNGTLPDVELTDSGRYVKKKLLAYSLSTDVVGDLSVQTTPTPTPTTTETEPLITPAASGVTGLTLESYNEIREDTTNTLNPRFRLINNSGNDVSMDSLTIYYYYTPESDVTQRFWCDYADVNGNGYRVITDEINMEFVDGSTPCARITFTAGAGVLSAGGTATLQLRITNEDWSNYQQSNDVSFSLSEEWHTNPNLGFVQE